MAETVRFISHHPAHRLVRKPAGEQIMPNGSVAVTTKEVVYEFEAGVLDLTPGQDMLPDGFDPETGQYEVEQDAISWLRNNCTEYGSTVIEVTPTAPPESVILTEVAKAAASGDVARLVELGNEEHATWDREDVLAVISDAIGRLDPEPAEAA